MKCWLIDWLIDCLIDYSQPPYFATHTEEKASEASAKHVGVVVGGGGGGVGGGGGGGGGGLGPSPRSATVMCRESIINL